MIALQKCNNQPKIPFFPSDSLHQNTSFALACSACATPPQDTPKEGENKTKKPHKAKAKSPY